jgi:hypothetical protein
MARLEEYRSIVGSDTLEELAPLGTAPGGEKCFKR